MQCCESKQYRMKIHCFSLGRYVTNWTIHGITHSILPNVTPLLGLQYEDDGLQSVLWLPLYMYSSHKKHYHKTPVRLDNNILIIAYHYSE
jgi:hypothetical protein